MYKDSFLPYTDTFPVIITIARRYLSQIPPCHNEKQHHYGQLSFRKTITN
jgi:hypothetical protein